MGLLFGTGADIVLATEFQGQDGVAAFTPANKVICLEWFHFHSVK